MKRIGYPNFDGGIRPQVHYDMQKWLNAIKEIYNRKSQGFEYKKVFDSVTFGWSAPEVRDFVSWMKFYGEGSHMKYKVAQNFYEGEPGYYLHLEKPDEQKAVDVPKSLMRIEEERNEQEVIKRQKQKIIGRLDSLEKLIRSEEGHLFSGDQLEALLESVFSLKRMVALVKKKTASVTTYKDLIFREGNVLNKSGFFKAAEVIFSFAQNVDDVVKELESGSSINPSPAPGPTEQVGVSGGLPADMPSTTSVVQDEVKEQIPKGLSNFLNNLETGGISNKDDLEVDDELEVNDGEFVSEAQVNPISNGPQPNLQPEGQVKPIQPKGEVELEVSEDPEQLENGDKFDDVMDSALKNVTTSDIVDKLEDLAKIFKVREVPRQLFIVDMMLNSVGIASLFPSLSEAINKSLESNNYISTRIEDIISKLRGTLQTNEIDLKSEDTTDEFSGLRDKLQENDRKEKERKEKKKKLEDESLDSVDDGSKETPEVEIEEDLVPPVPAAKPVNQIPAPKQLA
jgi:hypothetical protein